MIIYCQYCDTTAGITGCHIHSEYKKINYTISNCYKTSHSEDNGYCYKHKSEILTCDKCFEELNDIIISETNKLLFD